MPHESEVLVQWAVAVSDGVVSSNQKVQTLTRQGQGAAGSVEPAASGPEQGLAGGFLVWEALTGTSRPQP
ncbi:unnamed protein product [Rangifer tarandus platyrhynchus]|uniref:Uncharacterized protein n=2 Tax=Rangifer tarandus platyrhynchus TaxID=3082113 RepID=A0ACB0FDZ8_RANTA|nr:unnamed protein product [Rangifer tarandus platyrhynchus]CAI9710962.1 unnamed protein product [Rangifer tarandus platyrhynchus]